MGKYRWQMELAPQQEPQPNPQLHHSRSCANAGHEMGEYPDAQVYLRLRGMYRTQNQY